MLRSRFCLPLVLGAFAAVFTTIAADVADARGRISFGSRGTRTYSAPPATTTAPAARPIERSVAQPTNPAANAAVRPAPQAAPAASTNRPGFAGGLLGAGLFGLVLGAGLTGGLGGLASFLGLALQVGIIATVGWLLFALSQARNSHTATVPLRDLPNPRPSSQPGSFGRRNAAPR